MTPLDAAFLQAEDEESGVSLAISSIAVFEGPTPTYDEFAELLAGRIPLIPRYRQKAREVPLDLGPPVWVDASTFDLSYHLRHVALPAPGGDAELCALMGRVMSIRLDRDRPLWEYWLVEGLADGRWALRSTCAWWTASRPPTCTASSSTRRRSRGRPSRTSGSPVPSRPT